MNLVEQVGWDYFGSRLSGCIFTHEDKTFVIEGITGSRARHVNVKEVESPKSLKAETIPFDFFQSFSFLRVPPLGWRTSHHGRVLVRLSRNNSSYTRGVTLKNMHREFAPHTEYMFRMGKLLRFDTDLPGYKALLVTKPGHLSMSEGLDALNKGRLLSFTNSENIAVVPESDSIYNIMCGSAHVANISPEGEVQVLPGHEDFDTEILQ